MEPHRKAKDKHRKNKEHAVVAAQERPYDPGQFLLPPQRRRTRHSRRRGLHRLEKHRMTQHSLNPTARAGRGRGRVERDTKRKKRRHISMHYTIQN